MDPNASLASLREVATTIRRRLEEDDVPVILELTDSLVEYFEALDEWLTKGGALPAAWTHAREAGQPCNECGATLEFDRNENIVFCPNDYKHG